MYAGIAIRTISTSLFFLATVVVGERSPLLAHAHGQTTNKPGAPPPKSQPAASDSRSEDRAAIQTAVESFAKAFEAGDAKALAAHWTVDGEYQNESGVNLRGRDALESGFAEFFARTPDAKAEVHRESLRFLSVDSGIAEGKVAVRRGPAEPAKSESISALFVRDGGQWRIAQLPRRR